MKSWLRLATLLASIPLFGQSASPGVDYLPVPPNSRPLQSLLPRGGIGQHPSWGYLKMPERNLINTHQVDFARREVLIHALYYNTLSRDSVSLWSAYYQELATYTFDMYDIGFNRLWLNSLIGQKGGAETLAEGSLFDISLPVTIPAWMKDFGLDKPKLLLQGQMDIKFQGRGEIDDAPGSTKRSLWPSPTLQYNPSFLVKGKIGRNITVEVNNTEGGFSARNQIRVVYEEATPGEFEDYILQRVEAGSTSLSLKGTELTGYSENHQGLFGIKTELKVGDWWLTAIASQDGGSQEKFTMRANDENAEFQVQDKQFLSYRYYFLDHRYRNSYIEARIQSRNTSELPPSDLKLFKRSPINNLNNVFEDIVGVYFDQGGKRYEKPGLRLVEMKPEEYSVDRRTGAIRVSGASRNTLIAALYSGDNTGRPGTTLRRGSQVVLVQDDNTGSNFPDIDKLMLRNIYSIGISESNSSSFVLRMKDRNGRTGDYLKTLGVVDSVSGAVLSNDPDIFTKESNRYTGELWLPCQTVDWYRERQIANPDRIARERCLEPLRNIAIDAGDTAGFDDIYSLPVHNLNRAESRYYFESVGRKRRTSISVRDPGSSYSVNSGGCIDIAPNSEKLKAGAEVLVRDVDYQVNYELGQIELTSQRALDPNKEITVTYECEPLFEIDNKVLLGARAEYPLRSFSEGSLLGITALYKSQSTTQQQPRFGGEPFSSFLWGANVRVSDNSSWMDRFINALPFISTAAQSRWTASGEFAHAYHNPNTSDRKSALLDDFEGSSRSLQFSTYRTYWTHSSPPGGVTTDLTTYIPTLDYRYKGDFIWHSNNDEIYRYIYDPVGNTEVDNRRMPILQFTLRPNDNRDGKSWGGVMRSNSQFYQDLTTMRYIEIVARGNVGSLYLDLGAINEDISINGFEPNGELNSESQTGTTTPLEDLGLDGVTGAEERLQVWDCRIPGCISEILLPSGANTDVARDNFDENLTEDSDPPININGTEGNRGERSFDTEDLNRNGTLDQDIRFVRYRVDLSDDDPTKFTELKNGWRRWRIPLSDFDTIVSGSGGTWDQIIADARMTRLWYGKLNPGISEGKAQIVDLRIVGNQWEESLPTDEFGISTSPVTQTVEVDGRQTDITAPGTVVVPDSNYLKVRVINNRDDANRYFKSPNTLTERDQETNAALREQSLELQFGALNPGQQVSATRYFDTDAKDLTRYQDLKMEIHFQSDLDTVPVRFALQFGHGGLLGSDNYYEWSFRPIQFKCSAGQSLSECHEQNWLDNAFALALQEFSALKANRIPPYLQPVEKILEGPTAARRDERVKLVGNPSLGRINWIRFVIIADEQATPSQIGGTFWVNDLRLSGVSAEWGLATRTHLQLDFADVMSLAGEVRYQDGEFATLKSEGKSPKPTLAEAATRLDINGNFGFQVNKFFNDEYGLRMPLGLGYSATIQRPYLKPTSDQMLSQDDYGDLVPEWLSNDLEVQDTTEEAQLRSGETPESKGFQSFSRTNTFSFGYSKEYKPDLEWQNEVLSQIFLERPAFNYRYSETESRSATRADSIYSYNTVIDYKLGTLARNDFRPFKALKDKKWAPKNLYLMPVELWPSTFDVTLFDFTYARNINQDRDPDFVAPQVPRVLDFNADLAHKTNIRWNFFPFLTSTYSLSVQRDMNTNEDRRSFEGENFFSDENGGLFASDLIFDHDHTDREITVSVDTIGYDTLTKYTATGDSIAINVDDPNTYELRPITQYRIVRVGDREYGRAYGILRNERNRQQDFRINFNPDIVSFMPMRFTFGSTFRQSKTIPDNFDFYDQTQLSKNFWSIDHTNRFEFTPSIKLSELFGIGGKNGITKFLDKWRWKDVRGTWTVDLDTKGEDFTLAQLHNQQQVDPWQYYLYGLGLGDGYSSRSLWNLMTGDMDLTERSDFERFAQYRNRRTDTLVYQGRFLHAVRRRANTGTNFTLPWWDIGTSADLGWEQSFSQSREKPLYLDTTLVWPKGSLGFSVPNFAQRLAFTKERLRSLSASHRIAYTQTRTSRPFQSGEDEWRYNWDLNPLLKLSALTPKGIRIENDINFSHEISRRRPKQQVITDLNYPDTLTQPAPSDTSLYWLDVPWVHTLLFKDYTYGLGDEFSLSYDLKAKRGFQLWRWYIKLDNDINLRLASGYEYRKTIRETFDIPEGYDPFNRDSGTDGIFRVITLPDRTQVQTFTPRLTKVERIVPRRSHEMYTRPSASYQFNRMAQASAFLEYRRITEQLDGGSKHTRQILQFEIALLLRFN